MFRKILALIISAAMISTLLPTFAFANDGGDYEILYEDMTKNLSTYGGGNYDTANSKLVTVNDGSVPVSRYYQHDCIATADTGIRILPVQVAEGDIILASYWVSADYDGGTPMVKAFMQYTNNGAKGGYICITDPKEYVPLESGKWYKRYIVYQADRTTTGLQSGDDCGFRFVLTCNKNVGQLTKLGDLKLYSFDSGFTYGGKSGEEAVRAYAEDCTLSSISVDGEPLADFDPETKTYYVPEAEYGEITATADGMFADVSVDSSDDSKTVITVKAYPATLGGKTEYGKEAKNVYTVIKGEAPSGPVGGDPLESLTPADDMSTMGFYGMTFYDGDKVVKNYDLSGENAPIDTALKYVGKAGDNIVGGGIRGNSVNFKAPQDGCYVLVNYWVKAEMTGSTTAKPLISSAMNYIKANGTSNGPGIKDIDNADKIELPEAGKWYNIYNIFKIPDPTQDGTDMTSLRFVLGCSQYIDQVTYFGGYKAYLFEADYTFGGKDNVEDSIKALIGNNKLSAITNDGAVIDGFNPDIYEYSIEAEELGEILAETEEANATVDVDASDVSKIKIKVSQPYCFNDGKPCEYEKTTSRTYTINLNGASVTPPAGGDDEDDEDDDDDDETTGEPEKGLEPVDSMSSMVFFGGTFYDNQKSVVNYDLSGEDAPVSAAMKYVGKADGSTVGGGIRGNTPEFKVDEAGSYVLVTYWIKGDITDGSNIKPTISSKMTYIKGDTTSGYSEIKDIDGSDTIELPEAGKWYKIYNLFKIAEPTTGGDRTAVRFFLGCSKYLSQELYFGGYNAYLFAPDFTYGGETDAEKAIIKYVQSPVANSISICGEKIDGFDSEWKNYVVETDDSANEGDIDANVNDFSAYEAKLEGNRAVVTVMTHSFASCNEYGVYPNKDAYEITLMESSGLEIKNTSLKSSDGKAAEEITGGSYTLGVTIANKKSISAKLFAVLTDVSNNKQTYIGIKDINSGEDTYTFNITGVADGKYSLGVFAADDLSSPVALTPCVSVCTADEMASEAKIPQKGKVEALQNGESYMVDLGAKLSNEYALRTLVLAYEKGKDISESTLAFAKVVTTGNDGSLSLSFTPGKDGEYSAYVCDSYSKESIKTDFEFYSKTSLDSSLEWFKTASADEVEEALMSEEGVNGIPADVLFGSLSEDAAKVNDFSYISKALCGKTFADHEAFLEALKPALEETLICESFDEVDASELDSLVEKYGELLKINCDEEYGYKAFAEEQKNTLAKAISDSEYENSKELSDVIDEKIMLEVFNSFSWGKLQGAIEFYSDLEISMTKFNKLSSSKQTEVLKNLAAVTFDKPDDIGSKFKGLVDDAASQGGGGGSGGGSSKPSGYSGSFTTDIAPLVPSVPSTPATPVAPASVFADVPSSHWANAYVESLYGKGIVSGDGTGMFNPDRNLTRAEFVKMMVVAFGLYDANATSDFEDCSGGNWYDSYVASAVNAGLVMGIDENTFLPNGEISRQDMAVIAARCLELPGDQADVLFSDDASIATYARDAVYKMKNAGVINGMEDGSFAPEGLATRAMASKVIDLMMKL